MKKMKAKEGMKAVSKEPENRTTTMKEAVLKSRGLVK